MLPFDVSGHFLIQDIEDDDERGSIFWKKTLSTQKVFVIK